MKLKLLVDGGEMKPNPAISQKLGPIGINLGKLIQDINQETAGFKGIKIPVEVNIEKDKKYAIKIFSPPTSQLIKKELVIEKASGEQKKLKVGNLAIEQVIAIAKIKHPDMFTNDFKSTVKSIIGTCVSLGVLVENKEAKDFLKDVTKGKYDKEIQQQKTDLSPEKKAELKEFFENLHKKQEEIIKKEEEEVAKKAETKEKVTEGMEEKVGEEAKTEKSKLD